MSVISRLLTKNYTKVPLLWINFNLRKFQKEGAPGSCMCYLHPCLADDDYITGVMNGLCEYIREKYDITIFALAVAKMELF